MAKYAINGRIFEFPLTGVGRFCVEVIKELDNIVDKGDCDLLIPCDARNCPQLKNIKTYVIGKKRGIIWEQIELPIYLKKNKMIGLNMSNSAPVVQPDFVVIHDIQLKKFKSELLGIKQKIKVLWPLFNYRVYTKRARHIFTVSEFQKEEIINTYNIDSNRVEVVYNGWQHMLTIQEDLNILKEYNLTSRDYILAVSTRAKNKNFKWILENAVYNPNLTYVITGKLDTKYLKDNFKYEDVNNIITTGYVTDEELKALMMNAKAFIYPSLYEGFGIPPLEAISVGTKAIVAKASCLPEIYGDCVNYINPFEAAVKIEDILCKKTENPENLLLKYSWSQTAHDIWKCLNNN